MALKSGVITGRPRGLQGHDTQMVIYPIAKKVLRNFPHQKDNKMNQMSPPKDKVWIWP